MEPVGSSAFWDVVSTSLLFGGCVYQQEVPQSHRLRLWLLCDQRKTESPREEDLFGHVMSSPYLI